MRPWEVAQLTPWQVRNLYLCERDKEGRVVTSELDGVSQNPKDYFVRHWQTLGLRDDQIEALWQGGERNAATSTDTPGQPEHADAG